MRIAFPLFGIFLIFLAWAGYKRSKASKLDRKASEEFWQKEVDANSVRRVPLDTLSYILIPEDILLSSLNAKELKDNVLTECNNKLLALKDKRIFNLTGMTTTDIKLAYGPANVSALDEYDNNFTEMIKVIYQFGLRLNELGFEDDAVKILEFGIDSLTDISGNYKLLADLYVKKNQNDKLLHLLETAEKLNSLSKNTIISYIKSLE